MRRGWIIAIGVAAAIVVVLILNMVLVNGEAKPAEVTQPNGRIFQLSDADLQVVERGPRDGSPIVLLHCFNCSMEWWDKIVPALTREHRVITVDLLGHGGSEKPSSGYTIKHQADLVSQVLERLDVSGATVVGHSLGGPVSIGVAEQSPSRVERLITIGSSPDFSHGELGLLPELPYKPVLGQMLWRFRFDAIVRRGLGVAFAPGFDIPDSYVEGAKRLTYSAYVGSPAGFDDYSAEKSLPERAEATGKPTLAIMGSEEQIEHDPRRALAAYAAAGAQTKLIMGAGHSPNVETPALTARLILAFADEAKSAGNASGSPHRDKETSSK
jgi:pimeloyl-ACP methyl ester carboxylesterase